MTTALGMGVLAALATGCVTAVRHHGGDHDCVLVDILRTGGAARYDGLGSLPEHAAAFDGATRADELDQEIDAVHRRHEQEQGSS